MGLLDEWGDVLIEEGLREAADTFFGARKALEDDLAIFTQRVSLLATQTEKIENWRVGLRCFFGSTQITHDLFSALGVCVTGTCPLCASACHVCFNRPRSLTRKASFAKTIWAVYTHLAELIGTYMHGTYSPDPNTPGRMLLSVNLTQVQKMCQELNQRIAVLNKSNRPSESLGFARRLDQDRVMKERITGGGSESWRLDADLSFAPLNCDDLGLPVYPDLPVDTKARTTLTRFCHAFYIQHQKHADAMLAEIQNPDNKRVCTLLRQ